MNDNPNDRLYTDEHEWIKITGSRGIMGITQHAQKCLGDVVYVEMPKVGSNITKGQSIGVLESVKAVSDVYAPISGIIEEVNEKVLSKSELINQDPFGEGWLLVINLSNIKEADALLKKEKYDELLALEAK